MATFLTETFVIVMSNDAYRLFETLSAETTPRSCPKASTTYLYEWNDERNKEDWRADGYRWRQNGPRRKVKSTEGYMEKILFYVSYPCIYAVLY